MDKLNSIDRQMSFFDHLDELRRCLIFSLLIIVVFTALVYNIIPLVLESLSRPVGQLVFFSPFEAFWVELKIALSLGAYIAAPLVFFQIWRFVETGLYHQEKRNALSLAMLSFILFTIGAVFCYLLIIPMAVKFLLSYETQNLRAMLSLSQYVGFVSTLLFSFGMVFQLPLIIAFLVKIGIITPEVLTRQWRFIIVTIFVAAAVLTPGPDIFSQLLMAGPLIILYGISIIIAKLMSKRASQNSFSP